MSEYKSEPDTLQKLGLYEAQKHAIMMLIEKQGKYVASNKKMEWMDELLLVISISKSVSSPRRSTDKGGR